jgi:uncharacterized membrane protein required for colicin V production
LSQSNLLNELNLLDLAFILLALISFYSGYRIGFSDSLLKTIGYVTGGLIGLLLSLNYLKSLDWLTLRLILTAISIFFLATLGEFLSGKLGHLLRKGLIFSPIKFLNSLFGGIISSTKTVFVIYLIIFVFKLAPQHSISLYLKESYFYKTPIIKLQLNEIIQKI